MRYTPAFVDIRTLLPHQVLAVGTNPEGRHGKGAAKTAVPLGLRYGQAEGLMGRAYGIPTKELRAGYPQFTVERVAQGVDRFIAVARERQNLEFLVVEIGCGLSVFTPADIGPLFAQHWPLPPNVILPESFAFYVPYYQPQP